MTMKKYFPPILRLFNFVQFQSVNSYQLIKVQGIVVSTGHDGRQKLLQISASRVVTHAPALVSKII